MHRIVQRDSLIPAIAIAIKLGTACFYGLTRSSDFLFTFLRINF
jgi:hypothetical protein